MILMAIAAALEVATGLLLIAKPSVLARLLFDAELSQAGVALGRVTGFALLALGWSCWPTRKGSQEVPVALLIYNVLVTGYLAYLGVSGNLVGRVLWPAFAVHAFLSALLAHRRFLKPMG